MRNGANPGILDLVSHEEYFHISPHLLQRGNSPMDIALIEESHECISCLQRQYSTLQTELEEAKNIRDGARQLGNEIVQAVLQGLSRS